MQITYITIKPFTYNGKAYARNDVWEPQGFRADAQMISGRFVVAREEPVQTTLSRDYDSAPATPILADVLSNTPARRGRRVAE